MSDLLHPFKLMALNNAWANGTLYGAIIGFDDTAFSAPRPGFFPSLARTLNHIYEVDLFYIDALTQGGRGRAVFDRDDVETASKLGELQAEADMQLATFCHELPGGDLTAKRQTERREGPVSETVEAILLHLFQHQIHHRGQAHVQMQDAGLAPPQLDEFHLEFERAETAKAYFQ